MRDLSRASGMSLAGLYYYFESKERLLFLIQKHTFSTIVQRLKARLLRPGGPGAIRVILVRALDGRPAGSHEEGRDGRQVWLDPPAGCRAGDPVEPENDSDRDLAA